MKKNIIFMVLYQILILIIPFVTLPYISRVLGPEGVGTYAFSNSIVNYFILVSLLGIQLYGKREVAKVNHNRAERSVIFLEIYMIQFFMSVISILLYIMFIFFIPQENTLIFEIQIIMLFSSLFDISWLYFGMEKFKVCITRNLLVKIFSVILIFIFVKTESDLSKYVLIMTISAALSQLVMWFNIKKYIDYKKIVFKTALRRFVPIVRLFIPVLSIQLYVVLDKTMLGLLANTNQVGYFDNADRITRIPISIITALGVVMLPRMTSLFSNGKERESIRYIEKSLMFTMFFSIAATCGIFGISEIFVPLFLGKEFSSSIILVKVLTPIIIAISWGNVFRTQYILPKGMDNLYTKSVIFAAIINIIFNIILIPSYGAIGTAIASIVAEAVICLYQSVKIKGHFNMVKYLLYTLKYLASGVIMMQVVLYTGRVLKGDFLSLGIQIVVGALIYISLSLLLEKLLKQELMILELKKIFGKIV